jgi:hypothetical protein
MTLTKITGVWLLGLYFKTENNFIFWSVQLYSPNLLLLYWKSTPSLNFHTRRKEFACSYTQLITTLPHYHPRLLQFGVSFSLQMQLEKLSFCLLIQANDDLSSQKNNCHKLRDTFIDMKTRLWFISQQHVYSPLIIIAYYTCK